MMLEKVTDECIGLLKKLIQIPSFSREEDQTADAIELFLKQRNIQVNRKKNNIWTYNKHFDAAKPTILLNSHLDTVKPNEGYTRDPFKAEVVDDKLFGLGSNDAGGPLVSLIATFLYFYGKEDLRYNFCLAATAEEEISGRGGIESILAELGTLDFAIVGEPTLMQLAIAEKGLLVLDCVASGKAGHAARDEGENAIYTAMRDIEWFRKYQFPKISEMFGQVKMSVTLIKAGTQHNVVPASCEFTVDVRVTDAYSNEEVLDIIRNNVNCAVEPRSLRLRPSSIKKDHPIVIGGVSLGLKTYGSPTMSDQALLTIPSVKIGPGDSVRSHMADEFIFVSEIIEGVEMYIKMLERIV